MTTIATDTFTTAATATTAKTGTSTSATKTADIMGKEDFLTLLVAQLQNQDPLNPDDPTEFTAQLAQFSSLEQLYNLNESMAGLTTAQANSEKLSALSLIGKEVSYNGSSFTFEGDPVAVGYQLDGIASGVTLSIQDADGRTVKTLEAADTELKTGNHFITWDGTDMDGETVADGSYKIVLSATAATSGGSVAAAPLISSEVTGVDLSNGMLTTKAGEVLFNNLIRVTESANSQVSALMNSTSTSKPATTTETATGTVAAITADNTASKDDEQTAQDIITNYIKTL
ncbi:MAG: flagellar hook assembly protein FlgD [Desulfobulbaceae bacterium]|nr:flagellar hook assembly protein FlgD [Desulfobulbaceae bacterium]